MQYTGFTGTQRSSMTWCIGAIAAAFNAVNLDLLITQEGKRLNHRFSGASLCQEVGLPKEVVHIVYAHSKEGAFVERSIEAVIVSHADFTHFEVVMASLQG